MYKFLVISFQLCLLTLLTNVSFSQEKVYFETLPVPKGVAASDDPAISKTPWYRWTTKNFTVISVDVEQGKYLSENIEAMKSWCFTRWGFFDVDFASEARIYCVPDAASLKKFFNTDRSKSERRTNKDGTKVSYLWLILDDKPAAIIPPSLTLICLKEFEINKNVKFPWWAYRGMPIVNNTIPNIKKNVMYVEPHLDDSKKFLTKSIMNMTEAEWLKLTPEMRQLFDSECAVFCLLIRKEYGQKKFHDALTSSPVELARDVLGFKSYGGFDETFNRYMGNLITDIKENRTPPSYLQVVQNEK